MDEYTPTTEEIRNGVIFDFEMLEAETVARFDRWLAEVKAEAWEEGFQRGASANGADVNDDGSCGNQELNTYRGEQA